MKNTSRWLTALETAVTLMVLAASSAVLAIVVLDRSHVISAAPSRSRPSIPLPTRPVPLEGAHLDGNLGAKVAVLEYSDFVCPYCGRFAREALPDLKKEYVATGKILIGFRHLPLSIHPQAEKAAEAAECASDQSKFWQMQDKLFRDQSNLGISGLRQHAAELGLNLGTFDKCLDQGVASHLVISDAESAKGLAITGTPTFFIGSVLPDHTVRVSEVLQGAQSIEKLRSVLDKLISQGSQ